jgi:predicted DNA-binding protein (MmcQ/YjbR family)
MTFDEIEQYIMSKYEVTYDYPFDEDVRVYRVSNKIFALIIDETSLKINLKCDPIYALELRSLYKSIQSGYHMNKKHWNTIEANGDVDDEFLKELIDHSFDMVVAGFSEKQQEVIRLQNAI